MKGAVCVALACVLVLVDCMVVEREDKCETLRQCTVKLKEKRVYSEDGVANDSLTDEQFLDQFCENAKAARKCVDDNVSGCEVASVLKDANNTLAAAANVCSEGREETLIMERSECRTSQLKFQELNTANGICFAKFSEQVGIVNKEVARTQEYKREKLCPIAYEYYMCSVFAANNCGEEYGQFVLKDRTTRKGNYLEIWGCAPQVIQTQALILESSLCKKSKSKFQEMITASGICFANFTEQLNSLSKEVTRSKEYIQEKRCSVAYEYNLCSAFAANICGVEYGQLVFEDLTTRKGNTLEFWGCFPQAIQKQALNLESSLCKNNKSKFQEMISANLICSTKNREQVDSVNNEVARTQEYKRLKLCPIVYEYNLCSKIAANHCGVEYGQFVFEDLTTRKGNYLENLLCAPQVNQEQALILESSLCKNSNSKFQEMITASGICFANFTEQLDSVFKEVTRSHEYKQEKRCSVAYEYNMCSAFAANICGEEYALLVFETLTTRKGNTLQYLGCATQEFQKQALMLESSLCKKSKSKSLEMITATRICFAHFTEQMDSVYKEVARTWEYKRVKLCPIVYEFNLCSTIAANNCGVEYGQLVFEYLTTRKGNYLENLLCAPQVIQKRQIH